MSQMSEGEGNAKPPPKTRVQTQYWKLNYHLKDKSEFNKYFELIERLFKNELETYILGEEYGSKGITPHIEGYFKFFKKTEFNTIQKVFRFSDLRPSKKASMEAGIIYCQKEGNRLVSNIKMPKPLKLIENLYPYQEEIIQKLKEEPNDRDILWVFGTYSIGKTQLAKYLVANKIAFGPLEGEKRHILSVVAQNIDELAFILYLTADESEYTKHSFFDCIEKIKDGFFMSHFGTDNTKPVIMNSPHILVLANEGPDYSKTNMDKERFQVFKIDENMKFMENYCYNCQYLCKKCKKHQIKR